MPGHQKNFLDFLNRPLEVDRSCTRCRVLWSKVEHTLYQPSQKIYLEALRLVRDVNAEPPLGKQYADYSWIKGPGLNSDHPERRRCMHGDVLAEFHPTIVSYVEWGVGVLDAWCIHSLRPQWNEAIQSFNETLHTRAKDFVITEYTTRNLSLRLSVNPNLGRCHKPRWQCLSDDICIFFKL